jgi:hypothetical protein
MYSPVLFGKTWETATPDITDKKACLKDNFEIGLSVHFHFNDSNDQLRKEKNNREAINKGLNVNKCD